MEIELYEHSDICIKLYIVPRDRDFNIWYSLKTDVYCVTLP